MIFDREVANNDALISELNKESTLRYEQVEEEKALLMVNCQILHVHVIVILHLLILVRER